MVGRKQAKVLRVKAFRRRQRQPRGYVGFETVHIQYLQKKCWWGWKTLDEEIVPTDVKIALGATGYDSSNWTSKFAVYGTFGRGGKITMHSSTDRV
jgi:hypothetical protein